MKSKHPQQNTRSLGKLSLPGGLTAVHFCRKKGVSEIRCVVTATNGVVFAVSRDEKRSVINPLTDETNLTASTVLIATGGGGVETRGQQAPGGAVNQATDQPVKLRRIIGCDH